MNYLILQCGSVARGDSNSQSDNDFICIHQGQSIPICELKEKYHGLTFYSVETLKRMKDRGALFLTHLDIDAQILDGNQALFSVVCGFRPKKDHLEVSIDSSSNFLGSINWFPQSNLGELWLFDVLYVSIRNLIYCRNALNSQYEFGFIDAIRAFGLNEEQERTLLQVRDGKYLFRAGIAREDEAKPPTIEMKGLERLVELICESPVTLKRGGVTEWHGLWQHDYWDERIFERAIINSEAPDDGFRKLLQNHNYNRRSFPNELKQRVAAAQSDSRGHLTLSSHNTLHADLHRAFPKDV